MTARRTRDDGKVEVFVCERLGNGVRLTRRACGKRYTHLRSSAAKAFEKWTASACLSCPIGKEHARGQRPTRWPDGGTIVSERLAPLVGVERLAWKGGGS